MSKKKKAGKNGKHRSSLQKFRASLPESLRNPSKYFQDSYKRLSELMEEKRKRDLVFKGSIDAMERYYTGEINPSSFLYVVAEASGTPIEILMNDQAFTLSRSKSVMSRTKIDWCDYSWNPVVGCSHGCSYCYAAGINTRFKFAKDFNQPEFLKERLIAPFKVLAPSRVFVGSMSDPYFWKKDWWDAIIEVCKRNQQHTFIFLTKNPDCYGDIFDQVQPNMVLGATVDFSGDFHVSPMDVFDSLRVNTPAGIKNFISIEPLLGEVIDYPYDLFDAVIAGSLTGPGAKDPDDIWISSLMDNVDPKMLYLKESIQEVLRRGKRHCGRVAAHFLKDLKVKVLISSNGWKK